MKRASRHFGVLAFVVGATLSAAHAEKLPRWELGLGAGGVVMPDYRGSDEVRSYVLPFPYFAYRLDWLKADRNGVRATLFDSERVELNVSMGASPPVRSGSNRARAGMPDIKPMLEFGPSLDINMWRNATDDVRIDLRLPVRGAVTVGGKAEGAGLVFTPRINIDFVGLGMPAGSRDGWRLGLMAGPMFADKRQNAYFYGVAPQYARPDRPSYEARGGYAGTQFLAAVSRKFGKAWVGAYARWDSLKGASFEDSPLLRRKSYATAGFAVTWVMAQSSEIVDMGDDFAP